MSGWTTTREEWRRAWHFVRLPTRPRRLPSGLPSVAYALADECLDGRESIDPLVLRRLLRVDDREQRKAGQG